MDEQPQPCIRCNKSLDSVWPEEAGDQYVPYEGTLFTSHGHYGSTVIDSMHGTPYIEVVVCDDCLLKLAKMGRVTQVNLTKRERATYERVPWDPEEDR